MNKSTKVCNTCKVEKELSEFSKRNIKSTISHNRCKRCTNEYAKKYRMNNKEKIIKSQSKWYETTGKDWKKKYELENNEKINEHSRNRYKTDPNYRMKKILRSRFKKTVTQKKIYKSILKYIDLDLKIFLKWIEYQFDVEMSWENQGTYWDIDHVMPCKSFDLTNEDDVKKCFHWTNVRPLEKKENGKKSNKISDKIINDHKKVVEKFKLVLATKQ